MRMSYDRLRVRMWLRSSLLPIQKNYYGSQGCDFELAPSNASSTVIHCILSINSLRANIVLKLNLASDPHWFATITTLSLLFALPIQVPGLQLTIMMVMAGCCVGLHFSAVQCRHWIVTTRQNIEGAGSDANDKDLWSTAARMSAVIHADCCVQVRLVQTDLFSWD